MVETAVLERLCVRNGTEGSNPSLSAAKEKNIPFWLVIRIIRQKGIFFSFARLKEWVRMAEQEFSAENSYEPVLRPNTSDGEREVRSRIRLLHEMIVYLIYAR